MDKNKEKIPNSDLFWEIKNDILIISGIGEIPDYVSGMDYTKGHPPSPVTPWYSYREYNTVVVKEGITSIGEYAFHNSGLSSIIIPISVIAIKGNAFRYCKNLKSITINKTIKNIGYLTFTGCDNLNEIINYAITPQKISDRVFEGMDKTKCILKVPYKSIEKYKNTEGWKEFKNIKSTKFNWIQRLFLWIKKVIKLNQSLWK